VLENLPHCTGVLPSINSNSEKQAGVTVMLYISTGRMCKTVLNFNT
jgi:hypothetical protein